MSERTIPGPQGLLNISEKSGDATTPIMFVHADAGNLHQWDGVRSQFKTRPTVAFDRRGHGRSGAPASGSFDHDDAAGDIACVADALNYEHFFLVAHSGGALDAIAYASMEPDRIRGLVLVDPPADPSALPAGMIDDMLAKLRSTAYARTFDDYYRSIAGDDPEVSDRVLRDGRLTPKATVIGTFEAMAKFHASEHTGYDGPALSIIQSSNDSDAAVHRSLRMEHVVIDHGGHWIHLGAPQQFLDTLEDFVIENDLPVEPERARLAASASETRQGSSSEGPRRQTRGNA